MEMKWAEDRPRTLPGINTLLYFSAVSEAERLCPASESCRCSKVISSVSRKAVIRSCHNASRRLKQTFLPVAPVACHSCSADITAAAEQLSNICTRISPESRTDHFCHINTPHALKRDKSVKGADMCSVHALISAHTGSSGASVQHLGLWKQRVRSHYLG